MRRLHHPIIAMRLIHPAVAVGHPTQIVHMNLGLVTTPLAFIASYRSTAPFPFSTVMNNSYRAFFFARNGLRLAGAACY